LTKLSQRRQTPAQRLIVDVLQTMTQVVLVFLIISALIGRFEIQQHSMDPNFYEGQRVVVSRLDSLWSSMFISTAQAADHSSSPFALHRGQIAVFYETADRDGDPLIKRVIGVPGDTVHIRDGNVWLNNQLLNEPYLNGVTTDCNSYCEPVTLGTDMYFMMGDNRSVSRDSRSFGPVNADQVIGRVVLRYWPFDVFEFYP
jgi:signal peptidase I